MSTEIMPWQQLFEVAPLAISVVDPFGRQLVCNQAYADLFGYAVDEVEDIDVGRLTRAADQDWTRRYLTRLVSGEIDEYVTDKVYVRKDGSEFTARLTARAVLGEDGYCSMLVATIVPVETHIPVSESLARRLLEFTDDSLSVVDADGALIETTARYAPVLGYPASFWHDRTVFDVVAGDDLSRLLELREQLIGRPGATIETEVDVQAADGSYHTLRVRAANRLDDPEIAGIVITTSNITEHLRTVAELLHGRDTANEVADAQSRLLATVSHELRNPLHAVQGLAELLTEEDLPSEAAELAATLSRQLSNLTQVTQDLLDAARLDAGKIVIERRPTSLAAIVDDVVSLGRAAATGKPVDVSSRLAHGVPEWVLADGGRVRQVLSNLVGNAVKFTDAGSVQVVVRSDTDGSLNFSVIDTGVGIPLDEQAAVLEPFRTGSTGGERRGAGLGLSIVHRLVSAMGGRLRLRSGPGEGTRFDVWLPLEPTQPPGRAVGAVLPGGLRILVVEDNPVNQQLARSQLERLGLVPVIVGTGEAALEQLDDPNVPPFDAVLMDHQLPGISGVETTKRIRERTDSQAVVPIVGLSASASAADAHAFIDAGMDDFLAKPASLVDLSAAIARAYAIDRSPVTVQPDVGGRLGEPDADEDSPHLDEAVLAQLIREFDDVVIVRSLVETFLGELDGRSTAIARHTDPDTTAAQRAAHTLKSSARLLGATRLGQACEAIEADVTVDVDVELLAAEVRRLMQQWLNRNETGS